METTTGPLGQGITNGVGMALAEKVLAAQFNRSEHVIVDHHTYVFLGDGRMMEGISHEACSLGTLGLGKLVAFWDDNGISIDGEVGRWFTDDTPARFQAYGWQVIENVDGHDPQAISQAISDARQESDKPSLICCQTVIGWGSPNKQGKESCTVRRWVTRRLFHARGVAVPHSPFEIPDEVRDAWDATTEAVHRKTNGANDLRRIAQPILILQASLSGVPRVNCQKIGYARPKPSSVPLMQRVRRSQAAKPPNWRWRDLGLYCRN